MSRHPLNILVFGSLGPNADRIAAFRTHGHRAIYAYTEFPPSVKEIGPQVQCIALPRYHLGPMVEDLVKQHEIDIIYSLLNAHDGSTEATLELLDYGVSVSIVRHYKEHPCIPTHEERRVLLETDGQIYINEESLQYFKKAYGVAESSAYIVDGDLISKRYMTTSLTPKLRLNDGEPHVLIAGGFSITGDRLDVRELCGEMARRKVHTHIYGYPRGLNASGWPIIPHFETALEYQVLADSAPYVHLHQYVAPTQFVCEWSQYDVGLMHAKVTNSHQEAPFQRLNFAHRYSAYLAAGLPLAVQEGGQDAIQRLIRSEGIGVAFSDYDEFAERLANQRWLEETTSTVMLKRTLFSFEQNLDGLIEFLRRFCTHG